MRFPYPRLHAGGFVGHGDSLSFAVLDFANLELDLSRIGGERLTDTAIDMTTSLNRSCK